MALGSTRVPSPFLEMTLTAGLTSHSPSLKSPCTGKNSGDIILAEVTVALITWTSSFGPGVGEFDGKFLFADGNWVAGGEGLEACAEVVDDVEIAIGAKRVAQADVGAGGFGLRGVGLEECSEVQETRKGVTDLKSREVDIEISLGQAENVDGVVEREGEIGIRAILSGDRSGLECSAVIVTPLECSGIGEAASACGSVSELVRGEAIAAHRDGDVFVEMQRLSQNLCDHVLRIRIDFRAVVKDDSNGGTYLLKFE